MRTLPLSDCAALPKEAGWSALLCDQTPVSECMQLLAVARIALVKPDKARGVENLVLQMAQRGQITEKVSLPSTQAC